MTLYYDIITCIILSSEIIIYIKTHQEDILVRGSHAI
jgi:hypothetical protein